jgi:voltage-gated potassium channel
MAAMTPEQWEHRTAVPLLTAAIAFVGVLTYPVIVTDPSATERAVLTISNVGIWLLFACDYAIRLRLAPDRRRFVRSHVPDLVVVIVPALRPLRLLRLLSVARIVKRHSHRLALGNMLGVIAGAAALVIYLGAVGVLNYERPAKGANITGFGDALWWSCTTITTVGYGDHFPITAPGRLIAVVLMVVGTALLGLITAGIAAWLVQAVSRDPEIEEEIDHEESTLLDIRARLARIETALTSAQR